MPEEIKSLQNLQSLLDAMDKDRLGKKDFVDSFSKVVELVMKIQQQQGEAIAQLQETYSNLLANFENRHDSTLKDLRKQVDGLFVGEKVEGMSKQHLEKMRSVDEALTKLEDRMSKIRDGRDGKDGRIPKKGVDYFDGLLDEKALEELKKELREYTNNEVKKIPKPTGMRKVTYQKQLDLSGQIDGIKKVFDFNQKIYNVTAVISSQFPFVFRKNVDFTYTDNQLTFTSEAPTIQNTQTLVVIVETQFFGK